MQCLSLNDNKKYKEFEKTINYRLKNFANDNNKVIIPINFNAESVNGNGYNYYEILVIERALNGQVLISYISPIGNDLEQQLDPKAFLGTNKISIFYKEHIKNVMAILGQALTDNSIQNYKLIITGMKHALARLETTVVEGVLEQHMDISKNNYKG